jgi:KaiC/GvpD/RAD55 family RecA-like ATPase
MNSGMIRTFSTGGGIAGFDELFDGGIRWPGDKPLKIYISGSAGSGKSTLALELACLGRISGDAPKLNGRRCIFYYIIDDISERIAEKIEAFRLDIQSSWIADCPGGRPYDQLLTLEQGPDTFLQLVTYTGPRHVEELSELINRHLNAVDDKFDHSIVVIDSIASLQGCKQSDTVEFLGASCGGASSVRSKHPVVLLLVDERNDRLTRDPYLTDVYLEVWQSDRMETLKDGYCERFIMVHKAANCPHVRGRQIFRIKSGQGIEILPSLPAKATTLRKNIAKIRSLPSTDGRINFGIDCLDDYLKSKGTSNRKGKGSLAANSSTLLIGARGSLKTPIAMTFCKQALQDPSSKVLYLSLHEREETVKSFAKRFGLFDNLHIKEEDVFTSSFGDFERKLIEMEDRHRMAVYYLNAEFLPPEIFLSRLISIIRRMKIVDDGKDSSSILKGNHRIVIDPVNSIAMNYPRLAGKKILLNILLDYLSNYNISTLLVYDETASDAPDDRFVLNLVDNTFRLHKQSIAGTSTVLMQIDKIGNRTADYDFSFSIENIREDGREKIVANALAEKYYQDDRGKLVPATVKIFTSCNSSAHDLFNRAVCAACGMSDNDLDKELVQERSTSYEDILQRLKSQTKNAVIMAVDVAYLRDNILEHFTPLVFPASKDVPADFEKKFIPLSKNASDPLIMCRQNRSLKVIPLFIDTTILVCNLDLLRESAEKTSRRKSILKELHGRLMAVLNKGAAHGTVKDMPLISIQEFVAAAEEYNDLQWDKAFFGFPESTDPEIATCMFLEWLRTTETLKPGSAIDVNVGKWRKDLMAFARIFLPTTQSQDTNHSEKKCLFFHSWHSMLYASKVKRLYPVRIGQNWTGTKGGWCWGIVNNGMGGAKAREVITYGMNEMMNAFRINQHVGIPPMVKFCQNTGEISIYNLGMMKDVFQKAWARTDVKNYLEISPFLYACLPEFLAFLRRLGHYNRDTRHQVQTWLTQVLPNLKVCIDERNKKLALPGFHAKKQARQRKPVRS